MIFYIGVCTYIRNNSKGYANSAKIVPVYETNFKTEELLHFNDEELKNELNGQFDWVKPFEKTPQLDGIYRVRIDRNERNQKDEFKVIESEYLYQELLDYENTIDMLLEKRELYLPFKSLEKIYIAIEQWIYGPFAVEDKKYWDSGKRLYKHILKPGDTFLKYQKQDFTEGFEYHSDLLSIEYSRYFEEDHYHKPLIKRNIIYCDDLDKKKSEPAESLSPQERARDVLKKTLVPHTISTDQLKQFSDELSLNEYNFSGFDKLRFEELKNNLIESIKQYEYKEELIKSIIDEPGVRKFFEPVFDESIEKLYQEKYKKKIKEFDDEIHESESLFKKKSQEVAGKRKELKTIESNLSLKQDKLNKLEKDYKTYAPKIEKLVKSMEKRKNNFLEQYTLLQSFFDISKCKLSLPVVPTTPKRYDETPSAGILENEYQFIARWKKIAEQMGVIGSDDWNKLLFWHIAIKSFPILQVPSSDWIESWLQALGNDYLRVARTTVRGGWIDQTDWLGGIGQDKNNTCLMPFEVLQQVSSENESIGVIGFLQAERSLQDLYLVPVISDLLEGGGWNVMNSKNNADSLFVQQTPWFKWFVVPSNNQKNQQVVSVDYWKFIAQISLYEDDIPEPSRNTDYYITEPEATKVVARSAWKKWIRDIRDISDSDRDITKYNINSSIIESLPSGSSLPMIIKKDILSFIGNAVEFWNPGIAFNMAKKLRYDPWVKAIQLGNDGT